MSSRYKEIPVGKRFGKLIVVKRAETKGNSKHRIQYWLVRCDCGNIRKVRAYHLKSGKSRTCGCSKTNENAAFNAVFNVYKNNRRGLKFNLTEKEFRKLTSANCNYCGATPRRISKSMASGTYIYNGIDRVDNSAGYILRNCVSCCAICNIAKRDLPIKEFANKRISVLDKWAS